MQKIMIGVFVFAAMFSGFAEMRTWVDREGNEYKAEFIRELFDKLTLRDEQGKEFRVAVEDLEENDQLYLRTQVPPRIEINFSENSTWIPYETIEPAMPTSYIKTQRVAPVIKLKKISRRPFTSSLKLELFLVATERDGENYVLLSHSEFKVLFGRGLNDEQVFRAKPVDVVNFQAVDHTTRRGEDYHGYVLVLSNVKGEASIIQSDIGDWIEDPDVIQNLRDLAVKGAASLYSRHFDKTGSKTDVPRQPRYTYRLSA